MFALRQNLIDMFKLIMLFAVGMACGQTQESQTSNPGCCNLVQNFGVNGCENSASTSAGQPRVGKKGPKGETGQKGEKGSSGQTPHLDLINSLQAQVNQLRELLTNPPRSCKFINDSASGFYTIYPDRSVPPFIVYCNFTGGHKITQIAHNSEDEIQVTSCESARCYRRNVDYSVTMIQASALASVSQHCRQFIKYRCRGSVIANYAAWLSRDGARQTSWGGANGRQGYCACGVTGTCIRSSDKCNCDDNVSSTSDEGYLTDKNLLPVTGLMFGDATASESEAGWHTLGKFECWG